MHHQCHKRIMFVISSHFSHKIKAINTSVTHFNAVPKKYLKMTFTAYITSDQRLLIMYHSSRARYATNKHTVSIIAVGAVNIPTVAINIFCCHGLPSASMLYRHRVRKNAPNATGRVKYSLNLGISLSGM